MRPSRTIVFLLAAALLVAQKRARASGFTTSEFGSDHGQPMLGNPYAVYFNPGAMAGADGTTIAADGVVAVRSMEYDRNESALSSSDPAGLGSNPAYRNANTGKATLLNVLAGPFAGFVTDFGGSKLRLGVASYVPFGGAVRWDKDSAFAANSATPGAYDGPQRWASISASASSLYGTAAVAYRFEALRLGIGASVSVIRTGVTDTRARNIDGSDDVVGQNGTPVEGRSTLDVSGVQVGAALGAYWEPSSDGRWRVGVSYTSPPGFGTMRLGGSFRYQPGNQAGEVAPVAVDFLQAYPDIVRAGVAYRIAPAAELRLDATWERWSRLQDQCVVVAGASCDVDFNGAGPGDTVILNLRRKWRDSVRVRAGGSYWITPESELFASGAISTAPVGASHVDALTFDSTRIQGTLGATHAFTRSISATLAYTYVYLVPTQVSSSLLPNFAPQSRWPSANGHYSSELFIFDAALSYRF